MSDLLSTDSGWITEFADEDPDIRDRIRVAAETGFTGVGFSHADLMAWSDRLGFGTIRRALEDHGIEHCEYESLFELESWRVIVEQREDGAVTSEATVRLVAKGERVIAVGEGNGPVNALDRALRSALEQTFPELATLQLTDFKVRILEGSSGTGAITRVLVESGDGSGDTWSTVGVDENVISASWHALEEAVSYGLLRAGRTPD